VALQGRHDRSGPVGERRRPKAAPSRKATSTNSRTPPRPERAAPARPASAASTVGTGKLGPAARRRPSTRGPATRRASSSTAAWIRALVYKKKYGLDVKFVLIEDPAAKLAAFRKGDVDIMWNTVDNWAREASILAEQNQKAKSIIMQDWSRGGDGIVSLASHQVRRRPEGDKIACTQFTPSHFLLLYLLAQSGLSPEDRAGVEKNIIFTQDAPGRRRDVQGQAGGRRRDVGAGSLGRGHRARRRGARARLDDGRDQHHRRHALRAAGLIDKAPERARLRPRLVRRHRDDQERSESAYAVVGRALKLDTDTVSGMLSGLKLTPYADNAQFYGLTGGKAHYETLFDTAFVIWRKKGLVTKAVDPRRTGPTRGSCRRWRRLSGPEGRGAGARRQGAVVERPRDHQQADPDPLHARLRRDHARLVLRARQTRRDDDVVRQHVPARRGQHRQRRARPPRT
jgi:hypothetical protein